MALCKDCGSALEIGKNWLECMKKGRFYLCKSCKSKRNKEYRKSHGARLNQAHIDYRIKLKLEVLTHYSTESYPICANPYHLHLPNDPMLTDIDCLEIDHINGNGNKERKEVTGHLTGGESFYLWLKRNNYPKGYQVLCANCNLKKRIRNKEG